LVRTRPNKLTLLVLNLSPVKTIHQLNLVPFQMVYINLNVGYHFALFLRQPVSYDTRLKLRGDSVLNRQRTEFQGGRPAPFFLREFSLVPELCYFRVQSSNLSLKLDIGLGRRHETSFTLKQKVLAPLLIRLGNEFLSKIINKGLSGPPLATTHTVRILGRVAQVPLMTRHARAKRAKRTRDMCMVRLVE
jgi:hypothetical protein